MRTAAVTALPGLTAYKLSWIVNRLTFVKPDLRGRLHQQPMKKALLRALCDRYPNCWAGLSDLASKVGCSERHVQDLLRELEFVDRGIVDITPGPGRFVNHRLSYRVPGSGAGTFTSKKHGGTKKTVQYFARDRKILDWFLQWGLYNTESNKEDRKAAERMLAGISQLTEAAA